MYKSLSHFSHFLIQPNVPVLCYQGTFKKHLIIYTFTFPKVTHKIIEIAGHWD